MANYVKSVENRHPNHFGSNKVGAPCKLCRFCSGAYIWEEEHPEEEPIVS